jgi:uncharacterized membrane protein YeaQ/YmgE (transglycosylase-associated protein family)
VIGAILWTLIGGTIIGLLGKLVAPGHRDNIPFWLTVICGIGGVLVGGYIYVAIWHNGDMGWNGPGVDWWKHIWQVVTAAVLVMAAAAFTGRSKTA